MLVFAAGVASIVIIMVGVLMKDMFVSRNLDKSNLSRTLEDSSTMVLPLIPWELQAYTTRNNWSISRSILYLDSSMLLVCSISNYLRLYRNWYS